MSLIMEHLRTLITPAGAEAMAKDLSVAVVPERIMTIWGPRWIWFAGRTAGGPTPTIAFINWWFLSKGVTIHREMIDGRNQWLKDAPTQRPADLEPGKWF